MEGRNFGIFSRKDSYLSPLLSLPFLGVLFPGTLAFDSDTYMCYKFSRTPTNFLSPRGRCDIFGT